MIKKLISVILPITLIYGCAGTPQIKEQSTRVVENVPKGVFERETEIVDAEIVEPGIAHQSAPLAVFGIEKSSLPIPEGVLEPERPFPEVPGKISMSPTSYPLHAITEGTRRIILPEPNTPAISDRTGRIVPFRHNMMISPAAPLRNNVSNLPIDSIDIQLDPVKPMPNREDDLNIARNTAVHSDQEPTIISVPAPSDEPAFSLQPTTSERRINYGETVDIELPGPGWLYLGSSGEVEFISREVDWGRETTRFVFRVTGSATLEFESQDLVTGNRQRHEEEILWEEGERKIAAFPSTPHGRDGETGAAPTANTEEPSVGTDSRVSGSTQQPDETSTSIPLSLAARLDSGELVSSDPDLPADLLQTITENGEEADELSWKLVAEYLSVLDGNGEQEAQGELLEALWATPRWQSDEVLYRLAQYYDSDRQTRNVRRARDLYALLVDRYPFSPHVEAAENRHRYLNRHFFHIR